MGFQPGTMLTLLWNPRSAIQWCCACGPCIYVEKKVFRMLLRWKFSNLNFESKKVYRSIWRGLAVILQYFLCIISQVKYCYKARFGPYVQKQCKTANPCKTATQYMYVIIIISVLFPLSSAPSLRVQSTKRVQISCSLALALAFWRCRSPSEC